MSINWIFCRIAMLTPGVRLTYEGWPSWFFFYFVLDRGCWLDNRGEKFQPKFHSGVTVKEWVSPEGFVSGGKTTFTADVVVHDKKLLEQMNMRDILECPCCGSDNVGRDRSPKGKSRCYDCGLCIYSTEWDKKLVEKKGASEIQTQMNLDGSPTVRKPKTATLYQPVVYYKHVLSPASFLLYKPKVTEDDEVLLGLESKSVYTFIKHVVELPGGKDDE